MFFRIKTVVIFAVIMALISFFELSLWSIMIIVWFGIGIFILQKKLHERLNPSELKLWIILLYGYPVIETILKLFIEFNVIPYSYTTLNIAEHMIWALCISLYIWPFFKGNTNIGIRFIALAGMVIFIGNINEFLELGIRLYIGLNNQTRLAAYYTDTMQDLAMNIIGMCLGIGILSSLRNHNNKDSKVLSF